MQRLNREESQARTRSLLVDAARSEIARKGFAKSSVRDIADAAGFSQGAFYSNFTSKEDILLEVVRQHQLQERAKIEAAMAGAQGDAAGAMAGIQRWAATIHADPDAAALALELQLQAQRSPAFATGYRELNRAHLHELGELIARLFALLGRELPGDKTEIATGFIALVRGMALMSGDLEAGSTGRIVTTFLKAIVASGEKRAG
ncbi:MAG TPA: helix-turn-helix domain-containing protein [Burkholderiaceae bacterium]|jgi:AcrR family transcriptional regulator